MLVKEESRSSARIGAALLKGEVCHSVQSDGIRGYQFGKQISITTRQSKGQRLL